MRICFPIAVYPNSISTVRRKLARNRSLRIYRVRRTSAPWAPWIRYKSKSFAQRLITRSNVIGGEGSGSGQGRGCKVTCVFHAHSMLTRISSRICNSLRQPRHHTACTERKVAATGVEIFLSANRRLPITRAEAGQDCDSQFPQLPFNLNADARFHPPSAINLGYRKYYSQIRRASFFFGNLLSRVMRPTVWKAFGQPPRYTALKEAFGFYVLPRSLFRVKARVTIRHAGFRKVL